MKLLNTWYKQSFFEIFTVLILASLLFWHLLETHIFVFTNNKCVFYILDTIKEKPKIFSTLLTIYILFLVVSINIYRKNKIQIAFPLKLMIILVFTWIKSLIDSWHRFIQKSLSQPQNSMQFIFWQIRDLYFQKISKPSSTSNMWPTWTFA